MPIINKPPLVDVSQDPGLSHTAISNVSVSKGSTIPLYHWIPSPPDPRDIPYTPIIIPTMPTSVDLRNFASPIDDQWQTGSCTGNAIAGAIDLIDKRTQNLTMRVSRLFIYYQERLLEGDITSDNGAYIRDGIKACNQIGAPQETLWPFVISKLTSNPSASAYADAAHRKVTKYTKCAGFSDVKNALAAGTPVVIGFNVYSSFETIGSNGIMPFPNTATETLLGGHACCLVGYNDANNWFIARNSWGTNWGAEGYFYMPYSVLTTPNMASDFWTIVQVANP